MFKKRNGPCNQEKQLTDFRKRNGSFGAKSRYKQCCKISYKQN